MDSRLLSDKYGEFGVSKREGRGRPFFSVVMSAYNAESTVVTAIDSLLSQSFRDFELIVVDDGSKDSTLEKLKTIQQNDARLVVITQANMGLTKSLNRGIGVSRGMYIVRQDADDISLPHRLEALWRATNMGHKFVVSQAYVVTNGKRVKIVPRSDYYSNPKNVSKNLSFGNFYVHGTFAIERSLLENVGYDDSFRYSQDFELVLRLVTAGMVPYVVELPLYEFTVGHGSISSLKKPEQIECAKRAADKYLGSSSAIIVGAVGVRRFFLLLLREYRLRTSSISRRKNVV